MPAFPVFRFECTGCGRCCTGGGGYYVAVTRPEQRRIQRFLGVTWNWFRRRYMGRDEEPETLRWERTRCVFLDVRGQCRIYPVRPAQCRTYPFWPETVVSAKTWRTEARRCEGIGRGAVIPLAEVKKRLACQRND